MKTTIIYAYTKDNQAYVGKTMNPQNRIYTHKKRFGEWDYKILDEVPSVERKDWKPYECAWIQIYNEWGYELKNKNKGGNGPMFYSDEVKNKVRESKLGKKQPNISKAKKGIPNPKLSEALKGRKQSAEAIAIRSKALKGRKYSDEAKARMRKPKSKPRSAEHSAKIWASRRFNQQQNANTQA